MGTLRQRFGYWSVDGGCISKPHFFGQGSSVAVVLSALLFDIRIKKIVNVPTPCSYLTKSDNNMTITLPRVVSSFSMKSWRRAKNPEQQCATTIAMAMVPVKSNQDTARTVLDLTRKSAAIGNSSPPRSRISSSALLTRCLSPNSSSFGRRLKILDSLAGI